MKNKDKFGTPRQLADGFSKFCDMHRCANCPVTRKSKRPAGAIKESLCLAYWQEMEYEEPPRLSKCLCGAEPDHRTRVPAEQAHVVTCVHCGMLTYGKTVEEAARRWDAMVKTVKGVK